MVPLKLKELETCLERSNHNVLTLKTSLQYVLQREKELVEDYNELKVEKQSNIERYIY